VQRRIDRVACLGDGAVVLRLRQVARTPGLKRSRAPGSHMESPFWRSCSTGSALTGSLRDGRARGRLSVQNCLTFLQRVHELISAGSQFRIATHSPIVLAYPDSIIYHCSAEALSEVEYEESDPVRLTQGFLEHRRRFLQELLEQ
jgi:hypothetical protein